MKAELIYARLCLAAANAINKEYARSARFLMRPEAEWATELRRQP